MVNLLYPANLSIRMANIDISNLYVHVVVPTMDIFTCIWQEIKSKGGGPLTFSATGREEEIEMEFNSEIFNAFDDDCDLGEFLGHLIEVEIDQGKRDYEYIKNFVEGPAEDLEKHIRDLLVLAQDVALAVGFVLAKSIPMENQPALEEAEMLRNKLKESGIYDRLLGIKTNQKPTPLQKYKWLMEMLKKEKDIKN
jgi:hypothetical protein